MQVKNSQKLHETYSKVKKKQKQLSFFPKCADKV